MQINRRHGRISGRKLGKRVVSHPGWISRSLEIRDQQQERDDSAERDSVPERNNDVGLQ